MQALRLNEVLTRVVAWHNRHPLAQRVQAGQVHSIGEVVLPFASAVALDDSDAPPLTTAKGWRDAAPAASLAPATGPTPPAPAAGAPTGLAAGGLPVAAGLPDEPAAAQPPGDTAAAAAPGTARPPAADDRGAAIDDALDLALDLDMTPEAATNAETATATDADAAAAPQDPFELAEADIAAAELAVQQAAELAAHAAHPPQPTPGDAAHDHADLSLPLTAPPAVAPDPLALCAAIAIATATATATAAAAPAPAATAKARPGWLARLLSRLPGRPAGLPALPHLQAAFSRNFIWPLSARRVARWARAHGQTGPVAPPDWPRRQVDVDELLRAAARQKGLHHAVHLHLLTAAIGVGDRRIRVLIGADGAILGPRAFSRGRLASAAGLLATAVVGAGWGLLPARPAAQGNSLASAASGLLAPASAPEGADAAPHAVAAVPVPAEPPDAGPPAANATTTTITTTTATAAHTVSDAATHASTDAAAPAAAPAAVLALAADTVLALAADTASAPIARIKPLLSDEDRQAARQQAAALRAWSATKALPAAAGLDGGMALTAPAAPVYAVVTRARRQHQSAADDLALLRSAGKRLSGPLPAHGELVQNHGEWRAAWWPFANLADAERARVLLAGRGLKAEVVAF